MNRRSSFGPVFRVRLVLGVLVLEGPVGAILGAGIAQGVGTAVLLAVGFQLLFVPLLINLLFLLRKVAREVVLSAEGIAARTFVGRRGQLEWKEIAEVKEFDWFLFGQHVPEMRLIGAHGTCIALDGRMPGFHQVAEDVRRSTKQARRSGDERSRWRRQLLPM